MSKINIIKRFFLVISGLFIMALGVALSVKANLGVSPISCIPYIYSLKFNFSIGELTILMNALFAFGQFLILRKKYTLLHLSQLLAITVFGFCIDFAMYLIAELNVPTYVWQVFWCLLSCVVIAFGIFLLVKANLTYLPGDGLAVVITDTYKKEFGKIKVGFDSSMVTIGIISSFILLHRLEGVREGTVVAALLVGSMVKFYNNKIHILDSWLGYEAEEEILEKLPETSGDFRVITISREYGSGGHKIGQEIAKKLGIPFYDKELINITAEESGFTAEYIQENEQKLAGSLLEELYIQNYAYVKDEMPPSEVLFLVQSKIIRNISSKGPCVIVGRCANYILKDNQNCFNVFIHAGKEYRRSKIVNEYGVDSVISNEEIEKLDRERANYCKKYTGENWKDSTNYNVAIDSSFYGSEQIADKLIALLPDRPAGQ